ncbi:uncharacterized protein K460DRAFT_396924 [Cucurbitaria berberidis CBS 394.84]|uniref:Uncharacterized protein n=1 Tax=Cucurbitaria berberidis CBS 394.84 TaxID=1168544 RepID=A0A9P4GE21_9PLEO|nr:uncharacterized protein K460DRAFT_396924 [Cucurbitaria berberidis CBS 394.84]KAF1843672.1 hypothetical protein K460DRAFT_396924 [Cucurbitaria berberidis CBS 394.84]
MSERWKEAEEMVRPLFATIPPDHPDWIHNMYGYAHICFKLSCIEEAEKHCVEMLDRITQTQILSLEDPCTVAIGDLLLSIYHHQEREEEIAAIKAKIPGLSLVRNEDRFDPYAIRKGSYLSPQMSRRASPAKQHKTGPPARHI